MANQDEDKAWSYKKVSPKVGYLDIEGRPVETYCYEYGDVVKIGTRPRNWIERIGAGISWLICPKDVGFLTYVKYKPFYCRIVGGE